MAKTFEDVLTAIHEAGAKGLSLAKIRKIWPGESKKGKKPHSDELASQLTSAVREGTIEGPVKKRNSELYFGPGLSSSASFGAALQAILDAGDKGLSRAKIGDIWPGKGKKSEKPYSDELASKLATAVREGAIEGPVRKGSAELYFGPGLGSPASFGTALQAIRDAGDKGLSLAKIGDIWPGKSKKSEEPYSDELAARLTTAVREGAIEGPVKKGSAELYFGPGLGPSVSLGSPATFGTALQAIRDAGDKGLSLAKIGDIWPGAGKKSKKPHSDELASRLTSAVREGQIRGPFDGRSPLYFGAGWEPTVETVTNQVSDLVRQSENKLLSRSSLEAMIEGPAKHFLDDALRNAISKRLIAEFHFGESRLFLHHDTAAETFGFEVDPAPTSFSMAKFLPIYRRLKAEQGGFSAVKIYDVIRASGVGKDAVHRLLIAEAQAGRVAIHPTTSVELPRDVIEAGIRLEGFAEPFITVVVRDPQ